jgi:hypothetical protein
MSEKSWEPVVALPFETSEEIGQLAAALAKAQGEITNVPRTKTGQIGERTYSYADLADCADVVRGPLSKNAIALIQVAAGGDVLTMLAHSSGEWIRSRTPLPEWQTEQQLGKAITYLRRYGYSIVGIAPEDDADGRDDGERTNGGGRQHHQANSRGRASGGDQVISEAQQKRIFGLAHTRAEQLRTLPDGEGLQGEEIVKAVFAKLGIKSSASILRGYVDTVFTAVEKWELPDPAQTEGEEGY